VVYEILKPTSITLRLGKLPGTDARQRALEAWAVLPRDRRVELTFPDFRQPTDPADSSKPGELIQVRPTEMRETLRYEIALTPAGKP
jgi:hypothetical protein